MMDLMKRVREEKRAEKEKGGGDKDAPSSSSSLGATAARDGLGVRFTKAPEIEELRATRFVWRRGQGAAYTLADNQVLMRLTATVKFARDLGNTRALKLRDVSTNGSDRYNTEIGQTLAKINGIPDGTQIVMFYRIDEKTDGGDWVLSHQQVAEMILGEP